MANFNHAPILSFDIPKEKGTNYYELPQKLMDIIFKKLGNSSAQLKIMIVLIGAKPGFGISEQWMLERTGLTTSSYSRARANLINMGWISLEKNKKITVNFKAILEAE